MTRQFEGKVALVTGGASGMGRATALAFVREGAKVVIADIVAKGGESTLQMLREAKGAAIFVRTDVSKAVEVEALINHAVETYGRLDYAFNNAGVDPDGSSAADCIEDSWDRTIGVNLKGIWLCMKYEIPQMAGQGGGAIVNTSSINGLKAATARAAYVASKFGVVGLTKSAALDYAMDGIRVNAICPGLIHTPMAERFTGGDPEKESQVVAKVPLGRMGSPDEIAQTVMWLCSDAASFMTGHAMSVDGGRGAR